jgi:putative addiction module component (TIGR02574 family)
MSQMTPQISEVLEKALALSTQDRGLLIDRLIESLDDDPAEEGVEQAWADEIKSRVDDIESGKVEMIPGDEVRRRLAAAQWLQVSHIVFTHWRGWRLRVATNGTCSAVPMPAPVLSLPCPRQSTAFAKLPNAIPNIFTDPSACPSPLPIFHCLSG